MNEIQHTQSAPTEPVGPSAGSGLVIVAAITAGLLLLVAVRALARRIDRFRGF